MRELRNSDYHELYSSYRREIEDLSYEDNFDRLNIGFISNTYNVRRKNFELSAVRVIKKNNSIELVDVPKMFLRSFIDQPIPEVIGTLAARWWLELADRVKNKEFKIPKTKEELNIGAHGEVNAGGFLRYK